MSAVRRGLIALVVLSVCAVAGPRASAAALPGGTVTATYPSGAVALVTVHAAGHKLLFIVDSGASNSAVTAKAATEIGLTATGPAQSETTVGCTTQAREATISGWRLGKIALPEERVGILSNAISQEKLHGVPVVGLLGSDVLSQFGSATFDLNAGTLRLGGHVRDARAGIPMRVLREDGAATEIVRARIGALTTPFVLDTGSPLTVLPTAVATRLHLKSAGSVKIGGAEGCATKVEITEITTWTAGGEPLPTTPAFAIGQKLKLSAHGPSYGLIGAATLFGFGQMTLDFADGRLVLGRPS